MTVQQPKGRPLIQVKSQAARRICVSFIVCIWILAPYLILQQFSLYEVTWLQENNLDRLIPINLQAIYIYFSYYLFLSITAWTVSKPDFVKFMQSICFVVLISHLSYFFFPTGISRETINTDNAPLLYEWLTQWEKPRNCLPSLHASLSTLALLTLWKKTWLWKLVASLWCIAILWSAVALRQHVTLDIGTGILLACIIHIYCNANSRTSSKT